MQPKTHRIINSIMLAISIIMIMAVAYKSYTSDKEIEIDIDKDMQLCEQKLWNKLYNSDYPLQVKNERK